MSKKLSPEQQEESFRKIHGDRYSYDWDTYIMTTKKMVIVCAIHGEFSQTPNSHKDGSGCPKCSRKSQFLTFEEFINECRKIHGDKYRYIKESYINTTEDFTIICPVHGHFKQKAKSHKQGSGCPKCWNDRRASDRILSFEDVLKDFRETHGDKYEYIKESYIDQQTKMEMKCKIHGIFEKQPSQHKIGAGCPKCGCIQSKEIAIGRRLKFQDVLKDFRKTHGDKYSYIEDSYVNSRTKITIICPLHGKFDQRPLWHKRGGGCPSCISSKGEDSILNYLSENNLIFERQKTFDGCRLNIKLRFDFYIPSINTCIEYDGKQHSNFIEHWHKNQDGFEIQKSKDKIKNDYCKDNNINLIRISYLDFDNIEKILNSSLSKLSNPS